MPLSLSSCWRKVGPHVTVVFHHKLMSGSQLQKKRSLLPHGSMWLRKEPGLSGCLSCFLSLVMEAFGNKWHIFCSDVLPAIQLPVLFCLSVSVKWLAVRTASEMTYIVSSGALNSTPTNQPSCFPTKCQSYLNEIIALSRTSDLGLFFSSITGLWKKGHCFLLGFLMLKPNILRSIINYSVKCCFAFSRCCMKTVKHVVKMQLLKLFWCLCSIINRLIHSVPFFLMLVMSSDYVVALLYELLISMMQTFILFCLTSCLLVNAFSALMLSVGRQEGHPVECWHDYLSGTRHRLACGTADATATHCILLQ